LSQSGTGIMASLSHSTLKHRALAIAIMAGLYCATAMTALAAEADGGDSKGGLPQFRVEDFSSQIFWMLLVFLLLYQYLRKRILPRYAEVLEERSEKISGDLNKAEQLQSSAEDARVAFEASLMDARKAAHEAIAKAQEKAAIDTAAKLAKVESSIKGRFTKAENKINEQKLSVFNELGSIVSDAVQDSVKRIADIEPSHDTVDKAVKQALEARG